MIIITVDLNANVGNEQDSEIVSIKLEHAINVGKNWLIGAQKVTK